MAKVDAPLLSLDAHGAFGKALVFVSNRAGNVVRRYIKPRQNIDLEMYLQRIFMTQGPKIWQFNLTPGGDPLPVGYKDAYNEAAKGKPVTGMNLWLSDLIKKNQPLVTGVEDVHLPEFPGDNTPWQT